MEVWIALWLSGGKYSSLEYSAWPTKEQCIQELTLSKEEHERLGFGYGKWSEAGSHMNGLCIKVDGYWYNEPRYFDRFLYPEEVK